MGSCLSRSADQNFKGQGQTLGSSAPSPAPSASPASAVPRSAAGKTLGGSSPSPQASAEAREARAKAAEARAKADASRGGTGTGKLCKKLEEQKKNPTAPKEDEPERVVWD